MRSDIEQLRNSLMRLTARINAVAIENAEMRERMESHDEKVRNLEFDACILLSRLRSLDGSESAIPGQPGTVGPG